MQVKLIMRLRGGTKESGIARGSSEPTDAKVWIIIACHNILCLVVCFGPFNNVLLLLLYLKAMNAVADSLLTARKRVIKVRGCSRIIVLERI